MTHNLNSDQVIAVTNGSHITIKRLYVIVTLIGAVLLILGSYVVPPFIWKTNVENEITNLHKADTLAIKMINAFTEKQNTMIENQGILIDNQNIVMDNQVEIRTNVVDLRKRLHTGWITPIPDNYQRIQRLKSK